MKKLSHTSKHEVFIPDMDKFEKIKLEMQKALNEKRFLHVLSVAREAERLAKIFSLDTENIITAALLHDCTKNVKYEEHLAICKKYKVALRDEDLKSKEVLHAKTGAIIAREVFGENDEVFSMISSHSTGKEDMTVSEKIIFLADFIEPERPWEACKKARKNFYDKIEKASCQEEKIRVLNDTVLWVLEFTLSYLEEKGAYIHPDTEKARDRLKTNSFS